MAYSASFGSNGQTTARKILAGRQPIATASPETGSPSPSFGAPASVPTAALTPPPPGAPTTPSAPPTAPTGQGGYKPPAAAPAATGLAALPAFLRGLAPAQPEFPAGSTDPAYLAYLRSLEYQQQTAGLAAQQRLQALQQQMALSGQTIGEQGVIARRNISGAAESRGIFQSGERLQTLADERTAEAQRLAQERLSGATQYGGIVGALQQQLAAIANQRADQALANEVRNPVPA